MAIKAIIIDDERLSRNELKKLLLDHADIEVLDEATNVDEGIEKIEQHNPDLIFLDIQMAFRGRGVNKLFYGHAFGLGVQIERRFHIYKIDQDRFDEENF